MNKSTENLLLAFGLGVSAGLRSFTPLAVLSRAASRGAVHLRDGWGAVAGSHLTSRVLNSAAAGELVADKLPGMPSRTKPASFAFRILSGAVSGAAVADASGGELSVAALAGGLGSIVGTLGGYSLRKELVHAIGLPDMPVALLEDAVAVGGALALVRLLSKH